MKKILAVVFAGLMSVSVMTGCSEEMRTLATESLVDGTYRAEYSECDDYGWKEFVEITIIDGEINEVVFDGENADGMLKSEDSSYEYQMKQFNGNYPAKYDKDLINQFVTTGKIEGVDVVAGATQSTESFKSLVVAAMQNAKTGETRIAYIE